MAIAADEAPVAERIGEVLPDPTPATYATEPQLTESLLRKGTNEPGDGLYPRDGVVPVEVIEAQIAEVTLGTQQHNVIMSSGMSAAREAVLFAADLKGPNPKIAYADELYNQSFAFFTKLDNIGVDTVAFDSGGWSGVERVLNEQGADVIFAETVANGPNLSVLDIHRLLEAVRAMENPPIIILDNTLPLSTGIDFSELLQPDDPVLVIESGTKNLMNNSELLGLVYGPNLELIEKFRKHKAHSGAVNSVSASGAISDKLDLTIPGFHERNARIFSSTGKIAVALADAAEELGGSRDFLISHPVMPSHPEHEYAKRITPAGLGFISPVVFLESAGDAKGLIRRLSEHPALREMIDEGEIGLGQSFGLPKARLLYELKAPIVRFSGGFEIADEDALAAAIKEAAADK